MSQTQNFANKVAVNFVGVGGEREAALDPAFADLIIQILTMLIPVVEKCIEARAAKRAAGNPSSLQKIWLNNRIRRDLGVREFRKHGRHLSDAIMQTTAEATDSEIEALFAEN